MTIVRHSYQWIPFTDIDDQRIPEPDWTKAQQATSTNNVSFRCYLSLMIISMKNI